VRQLQLENKGVLRTELQVARRTTRGWGIWLLLAALAFSSPAIAQTADEAFIAKLGELREATFADRERIAAELVDSRHARVRDVLTALLEDRLYARPSDMRVFITRPAGEDAQSLELLDPLTLEPAGSAPRDSLDRIGTNNRVRKALRVAAARFDLANVDASVRLAAVTEVLRSPDEATVALLKERAEVETDRRVRSEIGTGLALVDLDGSDRAARLAAVEVLAARPKQQVRSRLAALVEKNGDGSFAEPDDAVRAVATKALSRIDRSLAAYGGVETLFFGLSLGSVLVLAAAGLAITFGVMGVINMAHGELMMLGAYTTYVVQILMPAHIGVSILVAIPAAFLVAGLAGVVLERCVIRFLYGRPLETLLATFGVSLVLQQLVRSIFTANNRDVATPSWMSGTLQLNDALGLTYNRLYIVLFTLIVFAILVAVLKRTTLGLEIRAVSQNRAMARAMGVRSEWVDAMTFGLGSGIAGVAGVALSQLTNVGPNLGQSYIIDSFMVVVFGGVGNLWGTLIGGMSMGIVNKLLEPYAGAVMGKILVLVAIVLFIQRRPRGLFPQMGRAADNA
jgi:urea transport system permease protein